MKNELKISKHLVWAVVILMVTMFAACQQEDEMLEEAPAEEIVEIFSDNVTSDDAAELEVSMTYLLHNQSDAPSNGRVMTTAPFAPCVVITRDTINRVVTIDFGTGCEGPDGRIRKGKVIVTFDGSMEDMLVKRTITFDNYFVNNVQYTGEIIISKAVRESNGNLVCTRTLKDFTLTFPNGNKFVTNGQLNRIMAPKVEGEEAGPARVWLTGKKMGRSSRGRGYNLEIIEPVVLDFTCKESGGLLRVSGIVEMTLGTVRENGLVKVTRRVDYGDGTCDKEYTVTINGESRKVTKED